MTEDTPINTTSTGPAVRRNSYLSLVVIHLNAPYGPVGTIPDLADALRQGTAYVPDRSPTASAVILSLFVEASVRQIMQCRCEAGADLNQVNTLYREAVADNLPRVPAWEDAIRHLL